jgi:DNA-binding NarL/FixJ family response regulator
VSQKARDGHGWDRSGGAAAVTVVVADDHPLFLAALRETIAGCRELTLLGGAADGQEALEMIRRHKPDVAVLDVRMPRLDGREVLLQALTAGAAVAEAMRRGLII